MGRLRKKRVRTTIWELLCLRNKRTGILVFDDIERNDKTPKLNNEPDFYFYNRSARPEMQSVRDLIENAISNYPKEEVTELVARIRSADNTHFRSATFELFLHEALRRNGFTLTPHPNLPNNKSRPDFLVKTPNGDEFYLEAVLASANTGVDKGAEARMGVVIDALSQSPHPNFMISIESKGFPNTPPSAKKLKNAIHKWLDKLNPNETKADQNKPDLPLSITLEHDGWSLVIHPIPAKKSTNLIASYGEYCKTIDTSNPIKKQVKFKGSKYGELDLPLVIAINMDSFFLDNIDVEQALFGDEQYSFSTQTGEVKIGRVSNGAWYGKGGPQYTRISAVWIFNDLHASSLATRKNVIYLNPWSNNKIPEALQLFPFAHVEDNRIKQTSGRSFKDSLGLHDTWPEGLRTNC